MSVRPSLHLGDSDCNGAGAFCPNCDAQITLNDGSFDCSSCGYNEQKWADELVEARHPLPVVAALIDKTPLTKAERAAALEEASLRG